MKKNAKKRDLLASIKINIKGMHDVLASYMCYDLIVFYFVSLIITTVFI